MHVITQDSLSRAALPAVPVHPEVCAIGYEVIIQAKGFGSRLCCLRLRTLSLRQLGIRFLQARAFSALENHCSRVFSFLEGGGSTLKIFRILRYTFAILVLAASLNSWDP